MYKNTYIIYIKNGGAHIWANTLNALQKMSLMLKNIQYKENEINIELVMRVFILRFDIMHIDSRVSYSNI